MNKNWLLSLVLPMAIMASHAATITSMSSPAAFVLDNGGVASTMALNGQPLNYCNKSDFQEWARTNLSGKSIGMQEGYLFVQVQSQWVALSELLVRNGYLYDPAFADALVVSAAERRGEWACASKDAVFQMVLNNDASAKVVAAIAMNESKYKGYPWPWTINYQGKSMYFESREQAYKYIMSILATGVMSVDIGITQINWKYHGHRFTSPWDALQPTKNILVSHSILQSLHARLGDWTNAIRCYHNCVDQVRGMRYLQSFVRQYDEIVKIKKVEQ